MRDSMPGGVAKRGHRDGAPPPLVFTAPVRHRYLTPPMSTLSLFEPVDVSTYLIWMAADSARHGQPTAPGPWADANRAPKWSSTMPRRNIADIIFALATCDGYEVIVSLYMY